MKEKRRAYISLKWVFAGSVMILLTVLSLATARIIIEREKDVLELETQRRLLAQCRNLASLSSSALLDEFPEFILHPIIKDLLEENPELSYAFVVDHAELFRGHPDLHKVDQPFEDRTTLAPIRVDLRKDEEEIFRMDGTILDVSVPVRIRDGSILGRAYLGIETEHLAGVLREAEWSTLRVLLITLAIGLIFTLFLVSRIVKPIHLLTRGTEEIGRGNLDYKIHVKSRNEIGILARTFNEMTSRLGEAQKQLVEKERLNRELEIAHEIEEKLLPRPNLQLPGYDVSGFHQSAQTVGGDYYDLIPIDDEHAGITVADVAGKGIPGLVVMAMTSALLRSHAPHYLSPAELLTDLNAMLRPNMRRGMFITMFYGILHMPSGRLTFAGAGHNPLIHFRREGGLQELLSTKGIPLGLFSEKRFADRIRNQSIVLEPGDGFVQYTDGVSEAINREMEEFGIDNMLGIVRNKYGRTSRDLVDSVVAGIREFADGVAPSDDITVFCVKRADEVPVATAIK